MNRIFTLLLLISREAFAYVTTCNFSATNDRFFTVEMVSLELNLLSKKILYPRGRACLVLTRTPGEPCTLASWSPDF